MPNNPQHPEPPIAQPGQQRPDEEIRNPGHASPARGGARGWPTFAPLRRSIRKIGRKRRTAQSRPSTRAKLPGMAPPPRKRQRRTPPTTVRPRPTAPASRPVRPADSSTRATRVLDLLLRRLPPRWREKAADYLVLTRMD